MAAPATAPPMTQNVVPSEVGWQFVPQYYTFVNKQPNRLHCFYTKQSTFIHGTEGEDGKPSFGQQEIHNRITQLGFQDCKVFIHSVDAQSSAGGGILIQVIGEMSNRGEPWRKFVQTFFLAEQPNGYFVLNDIFRFLKEESVESDEASEAEPAEPAPQEPPVPSAPVTAEPSREPTPAPPPPVEEPSVPTPEPAPAVVEPYTNGTAAEPEATPEPEAEPEPTPEPEPEPEQAPPAPEPSPAPPAAAPPPAQPTPPPPQQPAAPPAPKTWANLAAANSKKWGAAVAQESRGTSEAPPPQPAAPRTPVTPAAAQRPLPPAVAAQNITTPQCFVKGVVETVAQPVLEKVLTTRFGQIKELEIVRSKACAFLEFTTLDAAKRAIATSLPVSAGGEGGIRIDVGDGQQARISIETRKERGERPPPRPRGGAPPNGDVRGGFRGRGRGMPPRGGMAPK